MAMAKKQTPYLAALNTVPGPNIPGAGATALQDLTTRFEIVSGQPVQAPTDERLPFTDLYTDISAMATATPASNGAGNMAEIIRLIWQEVGPYLREDTGQSTSEATLLRSIDFTIKRFRADKEISRDRIGYPLETEEMMRWIAALPGKIANTIRKRIWDMMLVGDASTYGLAYDGQTFFDTDHPGADASGTAITQSNLFTGNLALNETNLGTVLAAMQSYRDEKGNRFQQSQIVTAQDISTDRNQLGGGPAKFHLYVGAANFVAATNLLAVQRDTPTAFAGRGTFDVIPEISEQSGAAANSWFVVRPGMAKPFALWEESERQDTVEDAILDVFRWVLRKKFGLGYRAWETTAFVKHA